MEAASKDRLTFAMKLMTWIGENPQHMKSMVFILGKTLGKEWGSAALGALWGVVMTAPKSFRENARRIGFEKGPDMGDRIFQAILDNPQGLWIGKEDEENNLARIKTESGKIELLIPELSEMVKNLDADSEEKDLKLPDEFPLLMNAGRHTSKNMNTLMRNPEWNKGKRACTIAVSTNTADKLGLKDGDIVNVFTEAGQEKGELEVSDEVRDEMVLIPHGFGLLYGDKDVYGINVNYLTKNTNRDLLGSPIHRFVPCRLEKA
jgi:anaerobic selenocysteine-containing dehydrogenase